MTRILGLRNHGRLRGSAGGEAGRRCLAAGPAPGQGDLRQGAGFVWVLAALGAAASVSPAASLKLQPHIAVYDLNLKSAQNRSGLVNVSGRLALELLGSDCEDWTINFRMVSRFFTSENVKLLDTQNSTWEAADGKTINVTQTALCRRQARCRIAAFPRQSAKGTTYGRIELPEQQQAELRTARFSQSVIRRRSSVPRSPARRAMKAPFLTAPRAPRPIPRSHSWEPSEQQVGG